MGRTDSAIWPTQRVDTSAQHVPLTALLDRRGCGALSRAYIRMRSFRGSYIGRRDTVAG